jgi:hypothetical protein
MSSAFLTPVGAEFTMPERSTVTSHPAGWLVSSPDRLEVFDATLHRSLFTAEFEGCGASTVAVVPRHSDCATERRGCSPMVVHSGLHADWIGLPIGRHT